jgi:hypothetical protein
MGDPDANYYTLIYYTRNRLGQYVAYIDYNVKFCHDDDSRAVLKQDYTTDTDELRTSKLGPVKIAKLKRQHGYDYANVDPHKEIYKAYDPRRLNWHINQESRSGFSEPPTPTERIPIITSGPTIGEAYFDADGYLYANQIRGTRFYVK